MTITKNYKEYVINGHKWWVEQYAEKPHFVWFWRYGVIVEHEGKRSLFINGRMLRSKPNLKRIKSVLNY